MQSAAKPYKLIPSAVFQRLIRLQEEHSQQNGVVKEQRTSQLAPAKGEPVTTLDDDDDERQQSVDAIIELLPKGMRRRARILLSSEGINFQPKSLRIIYSGQNGQPATIGSHLLGTL